MQSTNSSADSCEWQLDEDLPPTRLYKFKPNPPELELDRHRQLVVESKLYFAKPSELNDPFDCTPTFLVDAADEDIGRYMSVRGGPRLAGKSESDRATLEEKVNQRLRDIEFFRSSWLEHADKHGVCSLSASCTDPLLWAHYASGHRGYCVELSLEDQWLNLGRTTFLPIQVSYVASRPCVSTRRFVQALCGDGPPLSMLELFAHKDQRWAYEQEWRLVETPGGISRLVPSHCVSAIVLGWRCSSQTEETLRRWAAQRDAPVAIRRAVMDEAKFALSIVDSPS